MAIAFVKNVGLAEESNSSTFTITVPGGGVAVGNLLTVRWSRHNADSISSLTDTGGNVYSQLAAIDAPTPSTFIWGTIVTTALTSGNTIVGSFASMANRTAVADEFSGVTINTDGSDSDSGSASTPSISFDTSIPRTLILAAMGYDHDIGTPTQDADSDGGDTWHTLTQGAVSTGIYGAYKIATSALTVTYNPTFGGSNEWSIVAVALKEIVVPVYHSYARKHPRPIIRSMGA